jgi:Zn finger protein HypA/HybF involved in hydrogenase expression
MTTLSELRACKSCGNVFTKKAGVVIITSCPQCDGTSFDIISANEEIIDG